MLIAAHWLKNWNTKHTPLNNQAKPADDKVFFATIKGAEKNNDYKVEKNDNGSWTVTDLQTKKSATLKATDFDLDYGSLLRFKFNNDNALV